MAVRNFVVVILATIFSSNFAQIEPGYQPMVAFQCGFPAAYLTESGWMHEVDTDCVDDLEDVLNFCKKMFPTLAVRNVVESSQQQIIDSWCQVGDLNCRNSFTVRPYRCLVGAFQSDALLVPAGCVFDHDHKSHVCKSYSDWNATAVKACAGQGRKANSFAVLQPCNGLVGKFDGVEFVCCPEDFELAETPKLAPPLPKASARPPSAHKQHAVSRDNTTSAYYNYMHKNLTERLTLTDEHAQFVAAKASLREQHQAAQAVLAKDWTRVSQRVAQLNASDPQSAEKMNREAAARFKKAASDLETESRTDRLQLDEKHQQRVEFLLDVQRQKSLQVYHEAIAEQKQDASKILHSLKQYIKTEQKDRQHITNRFHHLLESDPELLASAKYSMAQRLRTISQNIQHAIDLLNQVTNDQEMIRREINNYMATFSQLDRRSAFILNDDDVVMKPAENINHQRTQVGNEQPKSFDSSSDESLEDIEVKQLNKPKSFSNNNEDDDDSDYDDGDQIIPSVKHDAHLNENEIDQQEVEPFVRAPYGRRSMTSGLILVTVGGCVVLICLVVASVVFIRRRYIQAAAPRGPTFSSLSQSVPAEDIHITSMQMTGYENPTYRFFEKKDTCNA